MKLLSLQLVSGGKQRPGEVQILAPLVMRFQSCFDIVMCSADGMSTGKSVGTSWCRRPYASTLHLLLPSISHSGVVGCLICEGLLKQNLQKIRLREMHGLVHGERDARWSETSHSLHGYTVYFFEMQKMQSCYGYGSLHNFWYSNFPSSFLDSATFLTALLKSS